MKPSRLVSQSARSLTRYKLRTASMMVGSLVGVAALTLVVSLGQGVQAKVLRTVRQVMGDASILVVGGGSRVTGGAHAGSARLTLDDMTAVAAEVPDVALWDPQAELPPTQVRHGDATATVRVLGQSERWERAWGRTVSRGASFDAAAVSGSARVALIGETVARALFAGEDPIDAEIRIGAVPFRVVGVLERFGTDMHGMDRDDEIVVPMTTLMRRLTNVDAIGAAKLVVRDPARIDSAAGEVRRVLRARHALGSDRSDDFMLVTATEVQRSIALVQRVLLLYVPLVAAVALVVGGIVAAMLMLAAVNERVAEIGLRRAVGASASDVARQFALETAGTVLVGAVIGIGLAWLVLLVVALHVDLGAGLAWNAVAISLVAAAATGAVAGVAPARRAARLQPLDALR